MLDLTVSLNLPLVADPCLNGGSSPRGEEYSFIILGVVLSAGFEDSLLIMFFVFADKEGKSSG